MATENAKALAEAQIRELVDDWARAIRAKHVAGVMAHYAADSVTFDLAPPLISTGADAKGLQAWFATWEGPLGYEMRDLKITAGDDVAFCHGLNRLSGTIRILPGSHDDPWLKGFVPSPRVQVLQPLVSLEFPDIATGKDSQIIVLCHYSMQVWDRSNQGSWHLFGHSHGKLQGIGLSFDVGVDCTDFAPLSLEMVVAKMAHLTTLPPGADSV